MDSLLQIIRSHVSEQPRRAASLGMGSAQIAAYSSLRVMIRSPRGMECPERAQHLRHEESIRASKTHWRREAAILDESTQRRSRKAKHGDNFSFTDIEV